MTGIYVGKVLKFELPRPDKLSRQQAQDLIRSLAMEGRVVFTGHGKARKDQRTSSLAVMTCLQKGFVRDDPYLSLRGDWRAEMNRVTAGNDLTVCVALDWGKKVIVVTTY